MNMTFKMDKQTFWKRFKNCFSKSYLSLTDEKTDVLTLLRNKNVKAFIPELPRLHTHILVIHTKMGWNVKIMLRAKKFAKLY